MMSIESKGPEGLCRKENTEASVLGRQGLKSEGELTCVCD